MSFTKNIIAGVLALLLASPACLCSVAGCGAACGSMPQESEQSCCSSKSSESDQDGENPPEKHECMCAQNKDYSEPGPLNLPSPEQTMLSALAEAPVIPRAKPPVFVGELTAAVLLPPPGPPLRILFSVFRL